MEYFLYNCPNLHKAQRITQVILNSRPQPPVNHPILLLTVSFQCFFQKVDIKTGNLGLYTLNMKSNPDLFLSDTYDLHENREGAMELLHSLCSSHSPVFYWDFYDLLDFLHRSSNPSTAPNPPIESDHSTKPDPPTALNPPIK